MKKISILIPTIKHPDSQDTLISQTKNILHKLEEKFELEIIWVVFESNKILEKHSEQEKILDFHNYKNAQDIINTIKPSLILIHGQVQFDSVSFAIVAKTQNILLATIFFLPYSYLEFSSRWFSLKTRLRIILAKNDTKQIQYNKKYKKNYLFLHIIKKYNFLLNTLKNSKFNFIQLILFIIRFNNIKSSRQVRINHLVCGDINFCLADGIKERLEEIGVQKSSIVLVGNPNFDEIFHILSKKPQIRKTSNKIQILFCPAPMHEHGLLSKNEEFKLIINTLSTISKHQNFEIALKIHPSSSSKKEYSKLLQDTESKIKLFQKENLYDLLFKYDVIISYGVSTIFLYSVIFRKPTIFLNVNKFTMNFYFDKQMITECTSFDSLYEKIYESISRKRSSTDYEKYILKHVGKFDGNNSSKIANKLLELLASKNK
jgi:UDP-N-acetylglucosamine 2-epimerase